MDQNPLQPLALFVRSDLAAHADVAHRGHEDQEASRQGDMRSNARALFGDGLLGDLNQNLLAGLEQVADDGQVRGLHRMARGTAAAIALLPAATATAGPAVAEPLRLGLAFTRGRLSLSCRLVLVLVEGLVVVAVLVVEVQLNAVIEVRFLEHLTQVAGAHLRGQRLLF